MAEPRKNSNVTPLPAAEPEKLAYRELPHNSEAEQLVLGMLLVSNEDYLKIGDYLTAEHFYDPVHAKIFTAIISYIDRGLQASPVTLKSHFEQDESLKEYGGAVYLAQVAGLASGILNIRDFAREVYELALRRKLISIGTDVVNEAHAPDVDLSAQDLIEGAEEQLYNLANTGEGERIFQPLKSSLAEAIERAHKAQSQDSISGVPTGFVDLDRLLGGMQDSDLLILAARPSMGKTALAVNIALHGAQAFARQFAQGKDNAAAKGEEFLDTQPKSVGLFSLEMSAEQVAARMLSMETGIGSNDIRRGRLDNKRGDYEKLIEANKALYNLPFFIDDTPALSIAALRTRARRLKRKHHLGLIVIDYLQLMRGSKTTGDNRVQEVSEITQGLKAIAKELNIPVLALSQLSRQVETRDDKRPQLSDLRESGSIEQDADVVMFIFREAYYVERRKPAEGSEKFDQWVQDMEKVNNLAEVMIAKHRNGPIANVTLFFDKMTTRFKDYDAEHGNAAAPF